MRKSRTILALILFTAVLISQCFTAYAGNDKTVGLGAIWTTNATGAKNNENHYPTIADVFLNGGPDGGSTFTDGHAYYVKVTTPNGDLVGSVFTVTPVNGSFRVCLSAIGANPGPGVYKVHVGIDEEFSTAKTDNFSLLGGGNVDTALLTIAKRITGQSFDRDASFGVMITPSAVGMQPIIGTITANRVYSVNLPYGTYTVSETSMPSGYTQSSISPGATVTLGAGGATVTITNNYGTSAPPVAADDYYQMAKDATLNLTTSGLLSNDSDPDGDAITFTQVTVGAQYGTVTTPNGTGAFTYTPNAGYTGEDHFQYEIRDEDGQTATATVHITISATTGRLTITKTISPTDAPVPSAPFTVSIKPDGGTASTRSITAGTPLELDLTPGWYTISETNVPAGYTPSYNPTDGRVQVTVGGIFAVAINNAYVHPNNPPVAVDDSYSLPKNSPVTNLKIMLNDFDPDSDAISLVSFGTPSNGSVSQSGNSIDYTPELNFTGQVTFTYTIEDEHGAQDTATVTITITETKGTLTIRKAITSQDLGPVELFTFTITPDGGTGFTQTVKAGESVSIDLEPGGYTVEENTAADYTPSYNPIDGHVHVTTGTTVSVIVSNAYYHANQPPVAVDDTYSVAKNAPATNLRIMGNDYDPDSDTISLLSITQPTHGTAVISGNTVNYTPTTDYFGPDSFTYTIKDAHGATDTATVTITVTDTVGTLTISKAIAVIPAGMPTSFPVTITLDGGSAHTHATVPAGGSVSVSLEPGWYTITEDADTHYEPTYDPIGGHVQVTTGAVATVSITNEFINNPPVAVNDSYSVAKNAPATNLQVMLNDLDPDSDSISLSSNTAPQHGTASIADGKIVYTPVAGYVGPDTFNYTIADAHGLQATATVTITITETKGTLTISKAITSQIPGPLRSFAVTITPVNGGDHTHATVTAGGSVSVDLEPGLYDVTEDTVTDYRPTYTPFDGRIQVATGATVTVGIANQFINNPPVAVNDSYTLPKNAPATSLTVMSNDSDPDSDAISLSTNTAPQHGTASISDGRLVYTPVAGYVGPDTFTYTIADAHGLLATATVTITIFETDGTVTITKQITGDSGWDPNQTFPVTIRQIVDGEVNPFVRQGVVSVNKPWNVPVPQGHYLVTEGSMPSSRYSPVSISNEGYFELGSTAMVTVTNRYTAPNPPPSNYPPVAANDQASTLRETPVTISVLLNDSDPDGDPLSITGTSNPGHGTATVIGNQITYTPAAGFVGTDTFTYTITDGQGHTATATVTVDVSEIILPPEEEIPGGETVLPKTGGINPLVYCGAGLALAGVGLVLRKRK